MFERKTELPEPYEPRSKEEERFWDYEDDEDEFYTDDTEEDW